MGVREVIESFPKKLDLWNIYLCLEMGVRKKAISQRTEMRDEAVEGCRLLFYRCSSVQKSSKKTKFVFKK